MIEVTKLRKLYGDFVAVQDVSFTVEPGEIFGLLGPNGAGKSTTIGCISGLLKPTEGSVRVLGHDVVREPKSARQHLGVVPQELFHSSENRPPTADMIPNPIWNNPRRNMLNRFSFGRGLWGLS